MVETRQERENSPTEGILDRMVDRCLSFGKRPIADWQFEDTIAHWRERGMAYGWGNAERIVVGIMSATEESSPERQQIQDAVRKFATELNEIGEHYLAKVFCNATEQDHKMLLEYARKHGYSDERGNTDLVLVMAMQEYGDAIEIDQLLKLKVLKIDSAEYNDGQVESVLENICRLLKVYGDRLRLPMKRGHLYQRLLPTAALHLRAQNYDAAISILHSGSPLVNYLHPLDQNAGYLEWHRHWKRDAVWRVTKRVMEARKGMRVLLCENDSCSGNTLRKVMQKIDALSPSSVDVCFTGIEFEKSKNMAEHVRAFNKIFHLTELNQERVFSDMLKYQDHLQSVVDQTKEHDLSLSHGE